MFMKLLEEWLDEYSQRPDRDPEWTWSDFENFATWLDNRSAQQSVNPTGSTGAAFHCSYCQQMVYPPHSHGDNASG
jgi:hypothetical protein